MADVSYVGMSATYKHEALPWHRPNFDDRISDHGEHELVSWWSRYTSPAIDEGGATSQIPVPAVEGFRRPDAPCTPPPTYSRPSLSLVAVSRKPCAVVSSLTLPLPPKYLEIWPRKSRRGTSISLNSGVSSSPHCFLHLEYSPAAWPRDMHS